jgi:hypothetical protein
MALTPAKEPQSDPDAPVTGPAHLSPKQLVADPVVH